MRTITCACGLVRIEADGAPLFSVICHCRSCRRSGLAFDARSGLPPIVDGYGGSAMVLWRKDRVRCVAGADRLEPHRLRADSPTRRLIASCCQTPLFLDFTKGFWVSVYRNRVPEAPPPAARVMLRDLDKKTVLPPDESLPHMPGLSARFMLKLLSVWAAMGFRRPHVAGVSG